MGYLFQPSCNMPGSPPFPKTGPEKKEVEKSLSKLFVVLVCAAIVSKCLDLSSQVVGCDTFLCIV